MRLKKGLIARFFGDQAKSESTEGIDDPSLRASNCNRTIDLLQLQIVTIQAARFFDPGGCIGQPVHRQADERRISKRGNVLTTEIQRVSEKLRSVSEITTHGAQNTKIIIGVRIRTVQFDSSHQTMHRVDRIVDLHEHRSQLGAGPDGRGLYSARILQSELQLGD